jgi:hypothetical protein
MLQESLFKLLEVLFMIFMVQASLTIVIYDRNMFIDIRGLYYKYIMIVNDNCKQSQYHKRHK